MKAAEDPDCHGYTLDDLVEETGRSKGHLSNRVNFLEKQGLVERFKIWNQPKTPFRLTDPNQFDPYADSPVSLELLD